MDPTSTKPLWHYVIAVAVVWAMILGGMWIWNRARFHDFALVCGGFFLGMLAMYIAVHLYQSK
jgi:fatty acid desaturase